MALYIGNPYFQVSMQQPHFTVPLSGALALMTTDGRHVADPDPAVIQFLADNHGICDAHSRRSKIRTSPQCMDRCWDSPECSSTRT